jgi:hypothetical protein
MTPDVNFYGLVSAFSNVVTPLVLMAAVVGGFIFFFRFQKDSAKRHELEKAREIDTQRDLKAQLDIQMRREFDLLHELERTREVAAARSADRPNPTIVNVSQEAAPESGGFTFIEVADEYKTLFADAMNGFADFAKLKGYNVKVSLDTSLPGKIGIRITILDAGVTVSTASVRRDVDEYIKRLRSADDLSDMPMATNPVEHRLILSALQARFSYLQTQVEIRTVQADFYRRIISEWEAGSGRAVSYATPVQITLTNEGLRNMRDSYNAENSQNIAQGKDANAVTKGSTILIGSTFTEKTKQIKSLKEIETAIRDAQLPDETKQAAMRYVQNAREEMEDSANPSPDDVGKWLGRADTALKTAGAAAGLLEKIHEVLGMFTPICP